MHFLYLKEYLPIKANKGASVWRISTEKSRWLGFLVLSTRGHPPKTSVPKGLCHVTTVETGAATRRHKVLILVARCPRLVGGQNKSALNHKVRALQRSRKCASFLQCGGWLLMDLCSTSILSQVALTVTSSQRRTLPVYEIH